MIMQAAVKKKNSVQVLVSTLNGHLKFKSSINTEQFAHCKWHDKKTAKTKCTEQTGFAEDDPRFRSVFMS